jgi:exonuclease 3'-5' domain-containing protein 1
MFAPELGGSYAVFDQRPLSAEKEHRCVQDVVHMPSLREHYRAKLCDTWWRKVEEATRARVVLSQSATYNGHGRHMAEGPIGRQSFYVTASQ